MSFFQRVATIATMSLGIIGLTAATTPSLAFELDRTINVPTLVPVPAPAEITGTIAPETPPTPPVTQQDEVAYASLAAAVADQDAPGEMGADLRCMAGAIYYEAKGEPLSGQLAVAEVIINRAKSGRFAKSVCSVITQRGQFSFVRGGRIPTPTLNTAYRTAIAVAQVALADHWDSPAADALYFHARRVSPGWRMSKVAAIGNHIFYR